MNEHTCEFPEEKTPGGRLLLGPCVFCGVSAMDAMNQLRSEGGERADEDAEKVSPYIWLDGCEHCSRWNWGFDCGGNRMCVGNDWESLEEAQGEARWWAAVLGLKVVAE